MRLSGHHSRSRVNGQEIQKKGSFIIGFLGCLLNWLSGSCLDTGCHSPTSSLLTESLWWQFSQIKPGVYLFQSRYCDSPWQWLIQAQEYESVWWKTRGKWVKETSGKIPGLFKRCTRRLRALLHIPLPTFRHWVLYFEDLILGNTGADCIHKGTKPQGCKPMPGDRQKGVTAVTVRNYPWWHCWTSDSAHPGTGWSPGSSYDEITNH